MLKPWLTVVGIAAAFPLLADPVSLNNPSFEQGTGGFWINKQTNARVDSSESTDGKQSLALTALPEGGLDVALGVPYFEETIYEISFDAKTDGESKPALRLSMMMQGDKPIAFFEPAGEQKKQLADPVNLTAEWQTFQYQIGPVPATLLGKEVKKGLLFFKLAPGGGKVWLDNIKINTVKVSDNSEAKKKVTL